MLKKHSRQDEAYLSVGERQSFGNVRNSALRDVVVGGELIGRDIDSDQMKRVLVGQTINVVAATTTAEVGDDTPFRETCHLVLNSGQKRSMKVAMVRIDATVEPNGEPDIGVNNSSKVAHEATVVRGRTTTTALLLRPEPAMPRDWNDGEDWRFE